MMKRRLRKVKYNGQRVHIEFEVERQKDGDVDWDRFTLDCTDPPRPGLREAFEGLRPHVALWLEMPGGWGNDLDVRGVTLSDTDGVMGAVITALKPLKFSRAPLVVNTPHKPAEPPSEGDPAASDFCLTGDCIVALDKLIEEANAYIDGERQQGRLFAEPADKEAAAEPATV